MRREADLKDQELDPNTCELLGGHQHAVTDIEALADSIATLGQLNAVQLIEYGDGRRLIAAGRRRWLACKSRGLSLRADIWKCEDEDIDLEHFARAVRLAENLERVEPSAIDVAIQMRKIRIERGFRNAKELGDFLGMSETRAKRYLSIFQGSDHLLEVAAQRSLPLGIVLELQKCEKRFGPAATRKLIDRAVKGDITLRDLNRMRTKDATRGKRDKPKKRKEEAVSLRERGDALLQALSSAPLEERSRITEELLVALQKLVSTETMGPDAT